MLLNVDDLARAEDACSAAAFALLVLGMAAGWVVSVADVEPTVTHLEDVDEEGHGTEDYRGTGAIVDSGSPKAHRLRRSGHSPRYAAFGFFLACHERGMRQHAESNGSGDRARTCNILVNSQTLYH